MQIQVYLLLSIVFAEEISLSKNYSTLTDRNTVCPSTSRNPKPNLLSPVSSSSGKGFLFLYSVNWQYGNPPSTSQSPLSVLIAFFFCGVGLRWRGEEGVREMNREKERGVRWERNGKTIVKGRFFVFSHLWSSWPNNHVCSQRILAF